MESYYKLSEVKKEEHPYFIFFKNLLDDEKKKNYINEIFNLPKLPLIGFKKENNNNSHLLGKLLSMVSFQIDICQGKERNKIEQLFSDFILPSNLNDYLNIEEVIEIDNNTDDPNINLFFMPKRKLNFYFIISDLPIYPDKKNNKTKSTNINNYNKINIEEENNIKNDFNNNNNYIDFFEEKKDNNNINKEKYNDKIKAQDNNNMNKINIIDDKKENLNKMNIINDKNDKNMINNKNTKYDQNYEEYEDYNDDDEINKYIDNFDKNNNNKIKNKFDNCDININNYNNNINFYDNKNENNANKDNNDFQLFNIIPHFFYINDNENNLLEIKNLFFDKQITLFALGNKRYYDIDKDNNKNFIDINNLRGESSNIVLVNKNNFVIEKDNLKFYLNTKNDLSQFYLIYTSDEDDHHSVFYYITCNNLETRNKMKDLLNKSMTIKDMIYEIEKNFGTNEVSKNLKNIFLNN